jgi:hypothetical protein
LQIVSSRAAGVGLTAGIWTAATRQTAGLEVALPTVVADPKRVVEPAAIAVAGVAVVDVAGTLSNGELAAVDRSGTRVGIGGTLDELESAPHAVTSHAGRVFERHHQPAVQQGVHTRLLKVESTPSEVR